MAETALSAMQIEESGGFRVQISENEISVSTCGSQGKQLAVYLIFMVAILLAITSGSTGQSLATIVVLAVVIALRFLFVGTHDLRCTSDALFVIDRYWARTERIRRFPRPEVGTVSYGAVGYSRFGANSGILFDSRRKKIKALYGLECIEAQRILAELERLGYDVYHDPGMPMAVEMEISRRGSWLGRLFR